MTKQTLSIAIATIAFLGLASSALAAEKTTNKASSNSNLALYSAGSTAFPSGTVQDWWEEEPLPPPEYECGAWGC